MFEGVAGCGKTRLILEGCRAICNTFRDSKGLFLRKTKVSLTESVLPIWEDEVLGPEHPAVLGGPTRRHRAEYQHPTLGGHVVLGGMDNPTRLFSTQWDWIYVNEMQEFTLEEWESLHRALRRGATSGWKTMPFNILLGDCNPDHEFHWANQRFPKETLVMDERQQMRLRGAFYDNPTLFSHERNAWTEEGEDYLGRLNHNLTGVRRQRLYEGRWVSAEGQVWDGFDPAVHVVTASVGEDKHSREWWIYPAGWETEAGRPRRVRLKWFFGSQDIGYEAPGVAQVWAVDVDERMWMVAEIYRTHWDHDAWAEAWDKLAKKYPIQSVVIDHDHAFQEAMNKRVGPRMARGMDEVFRFCSKHRGKEGEKAGIESVRVRLRKRKDGTRGIYFLRDSLLYGRDPERMAKALPCTTVEEIPAWVYPLKESGKPWKEEPDRACEDHGCDATRYAGTYAEWRDLTPDKPVHDYRPDTFGHILRHDDE